MPEIDFIGKIHRSTKRDYLLRVTEFDKAECAELAIQWGKDYWDGARQYGYGGFRYDGRWRAVAEDMIAHYKLPANARILDVGCGKGFLLYELQQLLPDAELRGLDISEYAVAHAKDEVKPLLDVGSAVDLSSYGDKAYDLVISINTLHNLYNYELHKALQEIERVRRGGAYITFDAYRTEREKVNLLYWQLTCRAFHTPREWEWVFEQAGYTGDYSFIFFE